MLTRVAPWPHKEREQTSSNPLLPFAILRHPCGDGSVGFTSRTSGYQVLVASTFVTWLLNLFEDFDDSLVALDNDVPEVAGAR